ncbi:MAG: zinc ribbon domain-containing protein [Terriglobales bacterium]
MHKDVETLLEAQGLEQRLKELDAEISSLPRRIALLEAPLAAQQSELDRTAAATATAQAERRKIESQIQDLKARVAKSRSHSAEVKTNQEYKAVLDEITYSEGEISRCEERILQLMEEIEAQEAAAREVQAKRAVIQAEVEAAKAETRARTEADQAEKQHLLGRLGKLRADINPATLRRYDRVARLRGHAVAALDHYACGACRVRLRPQFLQEITSRPEEVFFCETCGRLLYVLPIAEPAHANFAAAPVA